MSFLPEHFLKKYSFKNFWRALFKETTTYLFVSWRSSFTKLISVFFKALFHQFMKSANLLITTSTNNYCNIYHNHIKSPMPMLFHLRIVNLECSKLTTYFVKLYTYYTYIGNIRILEHFNTDKMLENCI